MRERDRAALPSSLGALRADWREDHLCLRCSHHAVCKMASALDAKYLVVVARCLAFEPAAPDLDTIESDAEPATREWP